MTLDEIDNLLETLLFDDTQMTIRNLKNIASILTYSVWLAISPSYSSAAGQAGLYYCFYHSSPLLGRMATAKAARPLL